MRNQHDYLKPSIAVVIPFYNGEKYWAELVNSLSAQTSKCDEVVIVLDGNDQCLPKDNLDEIAHQIKIVELRQNEGVANARNAGINAVESDYIIFLDQDDYFCPTRVAEVRMCIEKENPDWVVNNYKMVSENGDLIKVVKPRRWLQSSSQQKRLENQFMYMKGGARISTICCKKNVINKFDPNMGSCDDFVFILDLLEIGPPRVLDVCGNARRYHDSNNSQNIRHRQSRIRTNVLMYRKYGFSPSVRRKSLSNLCLDLAILSMVYRGSGQAMRNFSRAFVLYHLNLKALLGLIVCKVSKNPVAVLNRIRTVLYFMNFSKSTKVVGS